MPDLEKIINKLKKYIYVCSAKTNNIAQVWKWYGRETKSCIQLQNWDTFPGKSMLLKGRGFFSQKIAEEECSI